MFILLLGNDSFVAFEEILQLALEHDVDLILLSGDLFHDARPSSHCLLQCMKLLRKYTFGDKPISVQFLSENEFHESIINKVNYEDPNINVSIPVFSIHGNHDDPTGYKHVSSLDLLSCNGLVNYFGKSPSLTKVSIEPLIMRKGETKVALYGLSHIKDERLARLFADQAVTMVADDDTEEYFNILSIHQNRANRGLKKYVPEEVLPEFLDLIVWGHEHECRIEPEFNTLRSFYVTQPGSSVATSLAQGESIQKKVAILRIHKKEFKIEPLVLKTVRPFVFCDINLQDLEDEIDLKGPEAQQNVQEYIKSKIEYLIEDSKLQLSGHPKQPTLPLIRLRVTYFDERQVFNTIRFGQQFMEQVANPTDMVILKKFKAKHENLLKTDLDRNIFEEAAYAELQNTQTRVEDIVERYYLEMGDNKEVIGMSIKAMGEAVAQLIDKDDDYAIHELIQHQENALMNHLKKTYPPEEEIEDSIRSFSANIKQTEEEALVMLKKRLKISQTPKRSADIMASSDEERDDNNDTADKSTLPARGRGSRGGKMMATSRSSAASKGQLNISVNTSTSSASTTARGRGRGSRGRGATKSILSSQQQPTISTVFKTSTASRKKPIMYNNSDSE